MRFIGSKSKDYITNMVLGKVRPLTDTHTNFRHVRDSIIAANNFCVQ